MVFFSSIVVSLLAISTSLASPAIPVERNIAERDLPDFDLTGFNATAFREGLRRRQSANYNQDYTTGGTVDFSGSGSEFSVTWDTSDDFVVGRGWSTGTTA
jgi:endo-1,4-beta-xylanase